MKLKEDGVGVGAPTNNAGGGSVAGIGVGPKGEPGVLPRHQPKKNRSTPTSAILGYFRRKAPNPIAENKVYAIATRTRKGGLRRVPDTRFDTEESAKHYGDKYHTGKSGERFYEVVEHPDSKKRKLKEETFAGATVFEVSSHTFHNAKMEKRKGKHWRTYLDECDELAEIREYANKNPGRPIVLQNRNTNEMVYVRYGKAR